MTVYRYSKKKKKKLKALLRKHLDEYVLGFHLLGCQIYLEHVITTVEAVSQLLLSRGKERVNIYNKVSVHI